MNGWTIQAATDAVHPNRLAFSGVLTVVDVPSDKAPSGARGHRVVLTRDAAEKALPSLIGMAIDYKAGWDGHDARQKVGVITAAKLEQMGEGNNLLVEGYLFARDFPEIQQHLLDAKEPMGMSYELADAHVADMRAPVWKLSRATFTGAAILYASKAAYRATKFELKGKNANPKADSKASAVVPDRVPSRRHSARNRSKVAPRPERALALRATAADGE